LTDDKKPREFWIDVANEEHGYYEDEYGLVYSSSQDSCTKMIKPIHVIEHSAYESLRESLKLAVECLETAEAEIAVYSVTAYGHYQHDLPSLVMIRKAQATIKAKGEL